MEATNLIFPLGAYLIGSFPTGVVLSRRRYGIDVREMGSGNIGATNVTRNFGWYAGLLTFVFDFLKGFLPLWWMQQAYPSTPWLWTSTGIALVLGHCYSAFLGLRGGKGVATSLGCLLAIVPLAAVLGAISYLALLIVTRISAVGSLAGIATALCYVIVTQSDDAPALVLTAAISLIVLLRHKSNIQRLWTEFRGKRRAPKGRAS